MKRCYTKIAVSVAVCLALLIGVQLPAAAQQEQPYPFMVSESQVDGTYLLHDQYTATHSLYGSSWQLWQAIENMNPVPLSIPDAGAEPLYRFMGYLHDRTQYIYILYPSNIIRVDNTYYSIDEESWNTIKDVMDRYYPLEENRGYSYAQWLIGFNPDRVTNISTSTNARLPWVQVNESRWESYLSRLQHLPVQPDSGATYFTGQEFTPSEDMLCIQLLFDSGTVYTIWIEDKTTLYVESSAAQFGCRYTLSDYRNSDVEQLIHWILDPDSWTESASRPSADYENAVTGKPVIYLYPEEVTDVSVKLDFQGTLLNTDPAYNGGWEVTAQPDGTLTNKGDGTVHDYLFWDGTAWKTQWDFSSGFVVAGKDVENFFQDVLPKMGLTAHEYVEFIEYWAPEMQANAYNLVTFATKEYEVIAPLEISPQPDTVLRVHMVYKAIDEPVTLPEQVLPVPPLRNGFTVVEWGGTRG